MRSVRNTIQVLTLVSLMTGVMAAPASAADEVVFEGAGWGHGIGMTQYGAQYMATNGSSASEIISYYYQGATVAPVSGLTTFPNPLWIGLLQDRFYFDFVVCDNQPGPCENLPWPADATVDLCQRGDLEGECPPGKSVHPAAGESWRFLRVGDAIPARCQFFKDVAGAWVPQGNEGDCHASINWSSQPGGKIYLPDTGLIYARGELKIRHKFSDTSLFHVNLAIDIEQYLYGLGEMPSTWHAQALQAQAIAGRSYAVSKALAAGYSPETTRAECGCHLYSSTRDQAYVGWIKEDGVDDVNWVNAVNNTLGQVVAYGGQVVTAFYSSSSAGRTENNSEIWGGAQLPYLVSVPDPGSLDAFNPNSSWTKAVSRETVAAAAGLDVLSNVAVLARTLGGQAVTDFVMRGIKDGSSTEVHHTGDWARSNLGVKSIWFNVNTIFAATGPTPKNVGLHDPVTGLWYLRNPDGSIKSFYYGNNEDIPYTGDWNGDGVETLGLYRQSTGFLFLRNTNDQGIADIQIYYGDPGDVPIAGDWDGDGVDTVAIYRPSEGKFYLRNTNDQGIADIEFMFGDSGDIPLAGDWNGDGVDTVAVYRPSNKTVYFTGGHTTFVEFSYVYAGAQAGDRIFAGDWNGDGIDTVGVFRPSDVTFYLRDTYSQPTANVVIEMGASNMSPVAGFWGP
ncbi:MAG: SpoIID/LytB domain-containing protein [Acidimicrobiia bacterium]|nr:SpoIID/LytB domain-containing protein [Acidimicrobiia bacterium]